MKPTKYTTLANILGALLMLGGAATYVFYHLPSALAFGLGVALYAVAQLTQAQAQRDLAGRRTSAALRRLWAHQAVSLVVLACAAVLMYLHRIEWLPVCLLGAALQVFTAWRIDSEMRRMGVLSLALGAAMLSGCSSGYVLQGQTNIHSSGGQDALP